MSHVPKSYAVFVWAKGFEVCVRSFLHRSMVFEVKNIQLITNGKIIVELVGNVLLYAELSMGTSLNKITT